MALVVSNRPFGLYGCKEKVKQTPAMKEVLKLVAETTVSDVNINTLEHATVVF